MKKESKEIQEQIDLAFETPNVKAAVAKNLQAQDELKEVVALRADAEAKVAELQEKQMKLSSALKNAEISRKDTIASFQEKRQIARNLKDAEEDLADIDASLLSPAMNLEKETAQAVADAKTAALESVWKWGSREFQHLIDVADDFLAEYRSALNAIPGVPNVFCLPKLIRATHALNERLNFVDYHCSVEELGDPVEFERRAREVGRKNEEQYARDMAAAKAAGASHPQSHVAGRFQWPDSGSAEPENKSGNTDIRVGVI